VSVWFSSERFSRSSSIAEMMRENEEDEGMKEEGRMRSKRTRF